MRTPHTLAGLLGLLLATPTVARAQVTPDPRFVRGRALFDHNFHRRDGLGSPDFNADSCRACHRDPAMGGAGPLELNVARFGREESGTFTDLTGGQAASKLRVPWVAGREEYPTTPIVPNVFEQRQTPSIFGDGLIDTIPGAAITANEDPNDADGDGIRGVARRIDMNGTVEIGRFGWKAQVPRLADFVRDAATGELGLTTSDNGRGFGARTDADGTADPELADAQVQDISFFIHNLPAPERGGSTDAAVALGESLFAATGCAKCHRPSLQGTGGPVRLYSDLLLHNVMPAGFRGMAEPGAGMGMYRTPPLWGIKATAPYMHDGRAETLDAAIRAHAGEASGVVTAYLDLDAAAKAALLAFLDDL